MQVGPEITNDIIFMEMIQNVIREKCAPETAAMEIHQVRTACVNEMFHQNIFEKKPASSLNRASVPPVSTCLAVQ